MTDTIEPLQDHPAKFSQPILDAIVGQLADEMVPPGGTLLDPFAGVGRVHQIADLVGYDSLGVELEPEWAATHERTICGDSTMLATLIGPYAGHVDAIVTSPCMEQSHRMLTYDMRWVPCGDLEVGDELLAFNEHLGPGVGTASRRRWERATVVASDPMTVDCVRVILANGDEIVTTPNHPWLARHYPGRTEWIESRHLMGVDGVGRNRTGQRPPASVLRQVDTWTPRSSFDAGWLSGMFDGEGSLSLGVHGSPKLQLCQVEGPVVDRAERLMAEFGYSPNRIARAQVEGRQKIANLYVTDGFPGLLRALGELRPGRLLAKWETHDVSTRTIQPIEAVQVVAVEPAGKRDIQGIQTTSGTYIGEGYLMHNTYGNRLADQYLGSDNEKCRACMDHTGRAGAAPPQSDLPCKRCGGSGKARSKRMGYAVSLGRKCTPGSGAAMPWGPKYRRLHERVWAECDRSLAPGGLWLVNASSFLKTVKGDVEYQPVMEWHLEQIALRARVVRVVAVQTQRMKYGENGEARVPVEHVIVARKAS